jgi:hypothetical protein
VDIELCRCLNADNTPFVGSYGQGCLVMHITRRRDNRRGCLAIPLADSAVEGIQDRSQWMRFDPLFADEPVHSRL